MRKKLLATLLSALALALAFAIVAFAGCQNEEPTKGGEYYLSVLTSGEWTNYKSDADIPSDKKFVKEGESYTLSVDLDEGASVKIAQVGTDKTYGGDELFSANTQLTKGTDNAISVGASGTYAITLDVGEGTVSYKFTPKAQPATVVSVEIDDAEDIDLPIGGTKQLTATATLSDDTTVTTGITWESDDTSVATVDANGLVTAVATGTTTVIAKHGTVESDPVIVTVSDEGTVTLSETSLKLAVNGEVTLTYTATGNAVAGEWLSTDEAIATVDQTGKVKALKAGTATIRLSYTPKAGASPKFAECVVTVDVPVTNITLSNSAINVAMESTATLTVGIVPANATNPNYTYAISAGGDAYITVEKDGNTLTVTPVAVGTATITVTSEDGNHSATCEVTVVAKGTVTSTISTSSLSLNKTSLNNTAELTVSVSGDTISSVVWSSGKEGVATVVGVDGEAGKATVTGVAFGITTITASITTAGGQSLTETCTVSVAPQHFFLYGAIGTTEWTTDLSVLETQKMIFTDNNDGTYTITYDLPAGKDFRIGNDDGFTDASGENYVGIYYSQLDANKKDNAVQGGKKSGNIYSIQVDKAGNYTLTVDITGATPKLSIKCNSVAVIGISIEADNSTLTAGEATKNSAVITLSVNPSDATVNKEDIEWTCASDKVTVVEADDKKSVTVTAKDNATSGTVVVTCTVKGKTATVNLTVMAAGAQEVKPTSISFGKTAYGGNVNGDGGWTVNVSATVNEEATNQNVTYSGSAGITVDAATGAVTASKVGTYTVTATAAGDTSVTATTTVTFYSDKFYLIGDADGWGNGVTGNTTKDTQYENFTFEATDESNTMFRLEVVLTKNSKFQIMFCGGDWDTVLKGNNVTFSGIISKDNSNNFVIGGDDADGVYVVMLDISETTPDVNVFRSCDIPVFTAKFVDGTTETPSGESTTAFNRFTMTYEGTFAENGTYYIKVTESDGNVRGLVQGVSKFVGNQGYFEDATDAFKCLVAGKYSFEIVCDASGVVSKITVTPITDAPPEVSDAYKLRIFADSQNDWENSTEIEDQITYFGNGKYTIYFSVNVTAWKQIAFGIRAKDADANAKDIWASDLAANMLNEDSWLYECINKGWGNIQSNKSGTMYGALEFTVSGDTITVKTLTTSATDNLKPATEA